MKKMLGLLLINILFGASLFAGETHERSLFISVIQDPPLLASREAIEEVVHFAKQAGVQTLFVQIYRSNKAWFPSQVGDSEPYQTSLKNVGEDPFQLLLKKSHESGIKVHAWLNLLSLGNNEGAPLLKKYGTEILTKNLKEKKNFQDYKIDNQYFLEPGDLRVREELANMVGEILDHYPELDGIQFDYIRYPDRNPQYGYTPMNMDRFKKATGLKTIQEESEMWKNWKRDQVTELLKFLIQKIRGLNPKIQISTTGCMSYVRAYHEAFQDWAFWLQSGLVDFVTMMSYTVDPLLFQKYIAEAQNKTGDSFAKVNIGIAAYALTQSPEIFKKEFQICKETKARGCAVFHYGNLLQNKELKTTLLRSTSRSSES